MRTRKVDDGWAQHTSEKGAQREVGTWAGGNNVGQGQGSSRPRVGKISFLFLLFISISKFKFQIHSKFEFPDLAASTLLDYRFNLNIPIYNLFNYEFILYFVIFLSPLPF